MLVLGLCGRACWLPRIESTLVQYPRCPVRAAELARSDDGALPEAAADRSDGRIEPAAATRTGQAGIGPGGWTCFINVSSHSPSTSTWAKAPNSTASIRLWLR